AAFALFRASPRSSIADRIPTPKSSLRRSRSASPYTPSLHASAHLGGAGPGSRLPKTTDPSQRGTAEPDRPGAHGVPVLRALSGGLRPLPARDAGATVGRRRPHAVACHRLEGERLERSVGG